VPATFFDISSAKRGENMANAIRLYERGVRVFAGRLYNHDYLWFSSNEISKVSTTQPILHNYALCYALSQRSYSVCVGSMPKYVSDPDAEFGAMPLYATPADATAENVKRTTITFNAVDTRTLTTGDSKTLNTPNLGKRIYLNLQWEGGNAERPSKGYTFYVFTFDQYHPPGVARLGKKGCPVRLRWDEISQPLALFREGQQRPSHLINPLDVNGQVVSYDPVMIPPHLLLRTPTLAADWWVFSERHAIQVPKRVLERIGGTSS
jgi:CRISPR-associated protein Csc1